MNKLKGSYSTGGTSPVLDIERDLTHSICGHELNKELGFKRDGGHIKWRSGRSVLPRVVHIGAKLSSEVGRQRVRFLRRETSTGDGPHIAQSIATCNTACSGGQDSG